jgi:hypothetical protein
METRSQFNGLWLSGCDVVHVTTFSQTQNFSYLQTVHSKSRRGSFNDG